MEIKPAQDGTVNITFTDQEFDVLTLAAIERVRTSGKKAPPGTLIRGTMRLKKALGTHAGPRPFPIFGIADVHGYIQDCRSRRQPAQLDLEELRITEGFLGDYADATETVAAECSGQAVLDRARQGGVAFKMSMALLELIADFQKPQE